MKNVCIVTMPNSVIGVYPTEEVAKKLLNEENLPDFDFDKYIFTVMGIEYE